MVMMMVGKAGGGRGSAIFQTEAHAQRQLLMEIVWEWSRGGGKWGGHELRLELPLLWIRPHTVSHPKRPLFGAFCLFVYSALRLLKIKIPVAEAVALLLIF